MIIIKEKSYRERGEREGYRVSERGRDRQTDRQTDRENVFVAWFNVPTTC